MDVPRETDVTAAYEVYTSLDKKVDLLIERMSECVSFARAHMSKRTEEQQVGDMVSFGRMLRWFPVCTDKLQKNKDALERAVFAILPLRSERATILLEACGEIDTFYQNNHAHQRDIGPLVRNEMRNLIRFVQNLYPQQWVVGGFTSLHLDEPLIKWLRQDTQEVVVVSELAWKTECVVCLVRERDVVLYPCTHCCLCRECRHSIFVCPICRSIVTTDYALGDAKRQNKPFIMSTQFPGSEAYTRRLLKELQALGSEENER